VGVSHLAPRLHREMVAKFAPLTRAQFEALKSSHSYWPCNFHEDKYFESLGEQRNLFFFSNKIFKNLTERN
jgi:hypothetical protein